MFSPAAPYRQSHRARNRDSQQVCGPTPHSRTSSARARMEGGTVRPSALAVLRLITSSNLVGCSTGRSAGGALEDLSGVNSDLAKDSGEAASVADQAAGRGELAPRVDRRNGMACRQRHELNASAGEERVGADDERAGVQVGRAKMPSISLSLLALSGMVT